MILDAGVLISADRREPRASKVIAAFAQRGTRLRTSEPVVAQVWRGDARQARLARLLRELEIHPFADGRAVGHLLRASGTDDVVDAHLVLLALQFGEPVLTGDPGDLRRITDVFGPAAPRIHAWP